ncbi:MAG: LacI family transcriptional regulator [Clostridiales bacterium]|nr:LacI family transcriptional regulator [Clostridiales bacterium]
MASLQDVAKLAGVSKTLVSRVINHQSGVSVKTRSKIQAALDELNYVPNALARSLVLQKTQTIGVVMDTLCEPYFFPLIEGIEEAADRSEYDVLFSSGRSNPQLKARSVRYFSQGRTDGLILYGSLLDDEPLIRQLAKTSFPFIVIENTVPVDNINNVLVDNMFGAGLAVDHLYRSGCRRIYHVSGGMTHRVSLDRREGYITQMQKLGIAVDSQMIIEADFDVQTSYLATKAFLSHDSQELFPDAFFCASDNTAWGVMMALEDAGYKIPEDVMIVGFDDDRPPYTLRKFKGLTTLSQPLHLMGSTALDILLEDIEHKPVQKQRVVFYPELIIRETTGDCRPKGKIQTISSKPR